MAGSVSSKTYEFILSKPSKVGSTVLKAGRYKLQLQGTEAVVTEIGKPKPAATVPVKIEESDKKFEETRLITRPDGDVERVYEIDFGGSKTKIGL